tara:strand:- start:107 stop:340 length:234 start_codon:yes stop_codon:yes gene_type:complete
MAYVKISDFIDNMRMEVDSIHVDRENYRADLLSAATQSDYDELVSLIEECDKSLVRYASYLANLEECRGTPAPWRYL